MSPNRFTISRPCCPKGKPTPGIQYDSFDGGWWSSFSGSISFSRVLWGQENNAFAADIIWNGWISYGWEPGSATTDFPVPPGSTITSCVIVAREMKAGNEDTSPSGDIRLGSGGPSGPFDAVDFYDPAINLTLNPLTTECHIHCEDADEPVDYNQNPGNEWIELANAPRTGAFESWLHSYERHGEWAQQPGPREVDSWSHPNGGEISTPDLSAVVQQVIDRPGWRQEKGIRFLFDHWNTDGMGIYPPGDIASPFNQYGSWGELRDLQHPRADPVWGPLQRFFPELRIAWV